jgi:hypothetical protein
LLDEYIRQQATHALHKNVEENSHQGEWPVYEHYEFINDESGKQYIHAPQTRNGTINRVKKRLQPLSRESADLFLRFTQWVENPGMDKELETERNARAAETWAKEYGVLGLNGSDMTVIVMLNSQRVTADYLGMPWRGDVASGRRNTAHGGRPEESVENFAFEAWEAHVVWRLYESVRSQEIVNGPSAVRFMTMFDHGEPPITGSWAEQDIFSQDTDLTTQWTLAILEGTESWVEREVYSQDAELTRQWALAIVEDAVNRKLEDYCYPIVRGAPGSYEQSWGFKSLLGALWLQMMFLMRADRHCWHCGRPIDPGRRSHAKFCDNHGKCRANYAYHSGGHKEAKEQKRRRGYRNSGGSDAT